MPPQAGPPPEWVAEFLKMNPGASQGDAINEFALAVSERDGRSVTEVIGEFLTDPSRSLGGEIGKFVQSGISAVRPGVTGGLDLLLRGGGVVPPNPLASGIAESVVPQTAAEAATMAAAGPVSRVATGALRGVLPRLGAMAGVGASAEAATGGDPLFGAVEGAVAQGFGEVVRGVIQVKEAAKGIQRFKTMRAEVDRDAVDGLRGILQDVPAFRQTLVNRPQGSTAADDLFRIADQGEKWARDHFAQADATVIRAVGGPNVDINVPSFGARQGIPPTPGFTASITDALKELKLATRAGIKAPKGAEGFPLREHARNLRREILLAIERRDPGVSQMYAEEAGQYARSLRVVNSLRDSKAFEGPIRSGKGATFDGTEYLKYLQQNLDEMGPTFLKGTWTSLLRGAQPGATDVIGVAPRLRAYFGQGVSATTPNVRFMREPRGGFAPRGPSLAPPIATAVGVNVLPSPFATEVRGLTAE